MIIFGILFIIMCALGLAIGAFAAVISMLRDKWPEASKKDRVKLAAIFMSVLGVVASPYLSFKAWELHYILARVPDPLHVSWIEYRVEKSWGIGLPGDNETGFVIYRLTGGSSRWAQSKMAHLGEFLPGGVADWHSTPVNIARVNDCWRRYDNSLIAGGEHATITEYLGRYGYFIPIDGTRRAEADRAIQGAGSFYSCGRGGSVTIIDPARGKVYFAYAG